MKLDYYHIKSVFLKKGYAFYDGIKPYNLNILGVRCDVDTNFFDDLICIAYRDDQLLETVEIFQATTDAGEYWLLHPSNSQGRRSFVKGSIGASIKSTSMEGSMMPCVSVMVKLLSIETTTKTLSTT